MPPTTASRTALATSLMRALHTRCDPVRIVDDPWGDRLVPEPARQVMRQLATNAGLTPEAWLRASPAYATVVTRSRYAEDALHVAVARGCSQYVLVGAGFDSYALRVPPQAAQVTIFEVDHPATQALKRERLQACAAAVPETLRFVAADLATESLGAALARSGFDAARPAFFSWLGVTMYLTREANLRSLRAIAACAAAGSELVFTYLDQAAFEIHAVQGSAIGLSAASVGEPFLSGFDPRSLAQDLRDAGFMLLEDLDDAQVVRRYDPEGLNRLNPVALSRIAHARVAPLTSAATQTGSPARNRCCRP